MSTPTNTARLAGRVALVTGGSRGIGRAIARRLAAEGAAVAVNYRRDAESANEVVDLIRADGGRAAAYGASVDDSDAVAGMIAGIAADLGEVDILVSNAGTASSGTRVADTEDAEFLRLLRVHTLGPIQLIKRLLPGMRARPRSDIVVISSAITDTTPSGGAPYTMAKAAMEAAARTLALEEREFGIRVNIVAPGLVATEMGERLTRAATSGRRTLTSLDSDYPFGRVCRPEDVAGAVAFLLSADGSYVNGQRLPVDGGGVDIPIV